MIGLVEVTELGHQPVVTHLLAVVGGKNDQRIVPLAPCLQRPEQSAQVFVDLVNQAEILDHVLLGLANVFRRAVAAVIDEIIQ